MGGGLEHVESDTVIWMANDKAKSCLICHQKFSITKRKVSGQYILHIC